MHLIRAVEVIDHLHAGEDELVITLKNGKVIHISPDFNSLHVFENRQALEEWHYPPPASLGFDMGGTAAGHYQGEPFVFNANPGGI